MLDVKNIVFIEQEKYNLSYSKLNEITIEFKKNGFVILKDLFPISLIINLKKHFEINYKEYFVDKIHSDVLRVGNKRFQITIDIKEEFNSEILYANNLIIQTLKTLILDPLIISDYTCVTSLPGAKKMKIHRDGNIFIGNPLTPLLPPHAIGLLIPLVPFNHINGTTRFWPGSHRNNKDESEFEHDENYYDAELNIGDCILMDYRTVHVGNENISENIRPLLYINYSANWYFDPNNFNNQSPIKISDKEYNSISVENRYLFKRKNIYSSIV